MIYNWLKIIAAGSLFLFLKRRWKSLLIVAALISSFWIGHTEYLAYKSAINDISNIGLSYITKWIAISSTIAIYLVSIYVAPQLEAMKQDKTQSSNGFTENAPQHDGFDSIRSKNILRSKAQQIIESKQNDISD